jgi:signal transduction histidine kinase
LTYGSEVGSARPGPVAFPLLLECDLSGHVLWMSNRTRATLGGADYLADTIERRTAGAAQQFSRALASGETLRFSRVLASGEKVVICVQREPQTTGSEEAWSLLRLHGSLLRHNFGLQEAERNLSYITGGKRPRGGGRVAIRQMERERQRLGRELHTGVGQMLVAIRLQLEVVAAQVPNPPAPASQALDRISTLAASALEQVRDVSRRLHPPEWQRLSLEAALQQLWDLSGIPQRYQASLQLRPLPQEPDFEIKVFLYRAAQEALSNLIRHSRATRIEMSLEAWAGRIALTIQDNGVGFDTARSLSAPPGVASGIGLRSIRDQAEVLGGGLAIDSSPAGTRLIISAPFSVEEG